MYRNIIKDIEKWKESTSNKALLITGARQVGKTYIIREFAKNNYKSFIEFNFFENEEAKKLFSKAKSSKEILLYISSFYGKKLIKNETLIFLDEVQECPNIITAIKFLVEEGSYKYILSGSLLGVEIKNVNSIPVGYMDILEMYPLSFDEFCLANSVSNDSLNYLKNCFDKLESVNETIHNKFLDLYHLYLIVGGMPAAVNKYIETNNLALVINEQKSIINLYKKDIAKYDINNKLYLNNIYELIPSELNSQNKRFKYNSIKEGIRSPHIENSFLWLTEAGVAIPVYCVDEPKFPLLLSKKRSLLKLFLSDIGLLSSMYSNNFQLSILKKEKNINCGGIYENAIAQELTSKGLKIYYYNNKKYGELDLLVEINQEVIPIEIKSGKDYMRHNALNNVLSNPVYNLNKAYVFSNYNISVQENKIYLPIYMSMFLKNNIIEEIIYKIDLEGLK